MSDSQTHEYKHILPLLPASATWDEPITHDRFANQPMIRRIRAEMYASEAGTLYLDQSDAADMSGPTTVSLAVAADTTALFPWTKLTKRYYRWRFANDAAAQTARPTLKAEESGRPVYDTYVEDGQDEALGAKADTAATTDTGTFSLIALFKRLLEKWTAGITISGSSLSYVAGNYDATATAATGGGTTDITITPPAGKRYRMKALRFFIGAVPGATTGTKTLTLGHMGLLNELTAALVTANYNATAGIREWEGNGTLSQQPGDDGGFAEALRALSVTADTPLVARITNNTDAVMNNLVTLRILWEVDNLAS